MIAAELSLPECPQRATPFTVTRRVRIGDCGVDRKLRLDGVACYLQDIGFDHLDAMPDGHAHQAWIVRRMVIDVVRPISFGEYVTVRRWASSTSTRWCNMRVQIDGADGGLVETESFLIHFDADKGIPARMSEAFLEPILAATDEHRLRWRPTLTEPVSPADAAVESTEFEVRVADLDFLEHVNNAAYLQIVENVLGRYARLSTSAHRTTVEYVKPIVAGDVVTVCWRYRDGVLDIGVAVAGENRAAMRVEPAPTA